MAETANPAADGNGHGAPRLIAPANCDGPELPPSPNLVQRTLPPRRPIRPLVVLDSGMVDSSDASLRGRRLYWLTATDELGCTEVVADSLSLRDLQWLALQYQRQGWHVIDRTAGGAP